MLNSRHGGRFLTLASAAGICLIGGGEARAAPAVPVWPAPELVDSMRGLLAHYYGQRAGPADPYYLRAPEWDMDKAPSKKDPDTLFEYFGGPGTACHTAVTDADFSLCTGKRLARTFGRTFFGGSLYDAARGYYYNEGVIHIAAYYALYHAFARDFDAPVDAPYVPGTDPAIRNNKRYHAAMLRAYERHQRDVLVRLLRDGAANAALQTDVTRSVGGITLAYVRSIGAVQAAGAWGTQGERVDAIGLVGGLLQRTWWEWIVPQEDGPRTAGFAPLGSRATYAAAAAFDPTWAGTDHFMYAGQPIASLRQPALATGVFGGLWFDADYAMPGEWYCHARFPPATVEYGHCLSQAARGGVGGSKSPFGQYYGSGNCGTRAAPGVVTPVSCGQTNLGSQAEEWMWTFVGARAAAHLLAGLPSLGPGDPHGSLRAFAARVLPDITHKLGFGVSGFHGGPGFHDDMEWVRNDGQVRAIRTLSAGRHDGAPQDGLHSVGELDTAPGASAYVGDMWPVNQEEYPGGMENHWPGPNSLYGTLLLAYVLGDKPTSGLSPSLYDAVYRNNVDEFNAWIWLVQSAFYRCRDAAGGDPSGADCFAFDGASWPGPGVVRRTPLFAPADGPDELAFRYLFRGPSAGGQIAAEHVAAASPGCRGEQGIPWRALRDRDTNQASEFLTDEGGFGAFNEQIQAFGGLMRLAALRHPLAPQEPADSALFAQQRAEVLEPWYALAYDQVKAILDLYRSDYGYVPDIENSTCVGIDPRPAATDKTVLAWQYATGDAVSAAVIRRAMWYSVAALWYWQYDSNWLAVDPTIW